MSLSFHKETQRWEAQSGAQMSDPLIGHNSVSWIALLNDYETIVLSASVGSTIHSGILKAGRKSATHSLNMKIESTALV